MCAVANGALATVGGLREAQRIDDALKRMYQCWTPSFDARLSNGSSSDDRA